jgi:hypothetical protein
MLSHVASVASEICRQPPVIGEEIDADEKSYVRRLVRCPSDADLKDRSDLQHESRASRINLSRATGASADVIAAGSRFEGMALRANQVPQKVGDLLDVLLASASPAPSRGCKVLRPLWTEEAMHRAYSFVRLVDARNSGGKSTAEASHLDDATAWEDAIACDLSVRFRELAGGRDREVLPCSAILRDVVAGLGALFGSAANITFETKVDDVWLPGYKRRALVLATFELVCNALLHAFQGRVAGQIEVHLAASDLGSACLRVADDGIGFTGSVPNLELGVGAGLAGLLEADLIYDRIAGWTIAEIAFPLPTSSLAADLDRDTRGLSINGAYGREYPCRGSNVQYLV